jgi:hypothetical protein
MAAVQTEPCLWALITTTTTNNNSNNNNNNNNPYPANVENMVSS